MTDTKSSISKQIQEDSKKIKILGAQSLIVSWLKGERLESVINRTEAEELIIDAAREIKQPELQKKWVKKVRGNGQDPRRVNLAEKCAAAIKERYQK